MEKESEADRAALDDRDLAGEVQADVVDRYAGLLAFCRGLMEEIDADEASPGFSRVDEKVPALYGVLDTLAPKGRQIDQVVQKIEEDGEPGERSKSATELVGIRREMMRMMDELSRKHADLLKAGGTLGGMRVFASGAPDGFCQEVAKWYGEAAGRASGVEPKAVSAEKDGDGWRVIVLGDQGGLVVLVDDQLRFSGAYPMSGPPPMSYDHYVGVARPAMMGIGHWAPPHLGGVILSARPPGFSPGGEALDEFLGYVPGKGPVTYRVRLVGGRETKMRSCLIEALSMEKRASVSSEVKGRLAARRQEIARAALVVVRKPGKYQGMGGPVVADEIVERNDHLEFPVELEFDTGLRTKVWVTDEDVEVALSK